MDTTDELVALSKVAVEAFDELLRRAQAEQPPEQPLACRAGCAHCCHQPEITVTAIELFRITDFIISEFSDAEIESLVKTLPDVQKLPLPPQNPASLVLRPCPLLRDNECTVYSARALVCRSANSYDVTDCERARKQNRQYPIIHNYAPQERAARLTLEMLQQGIASAGREETLLDLAPALALALNDPTAKQRWQDGEQVFVKARANL